MAFPAKSIAAERMLTHGGSVQLHRTGDREGADKGEMLPSMCRGRPNRIV